MIYNWLSKHKKSAYGIAIAFLIFTILVYAFRSCWFFRPLYEYIDYWALPLSAAFMLVLAYMAYISITEDRRIRKEERERDFRRRCLSDIEDWAEKGISLLIEIRLPEHQWVKSHQLLKPLSAKNKWMMDASRVFAEDDKKALLKKVDEAAENLKQYCEVLEKNISGSYLTDEKEMLSRHEGLLKSFNEVLARIADLKIKLQL